MSTNTLYYPWMHFQDEGWLKLALLTWDSMARVRARDVDDRDSDTVRQVIQETNFLKEITPSHRDLEEVNAAFMEIFEIAGDQIATRFRHDQADWAKEYAAYEPPVSQRPRSPRNDLTWIYCGPAGPKVAYVLQEQLLMRGMAVYHQGSWLGMRPKLASIYLAALADAIARHNRISPVTDDVRVHHAVGAVDRLAELMLNDDHKASALQNPREAYIHLALNAVIVPKQLTHIPVQKIIRFRNDHAAELAAFHEHVAGLADELLEIAEVENLDIAQAHLQSIFQKSTKPQLDDLRRALRTFGIDSVVGSLGLKFDAQAAAGTFLGGLAAASGHLTVAGASIGVTIVPYLAGKYKGYREARRTSPVAYLLAVDRKLTD
ncbi:hypothetical protein GCM10023195_67320 [Actinoallomurus liliacearum]|uniref:Uncharacterized protein n=1 Tax=Actinoallomurus liliacearum TaxID=1080073 RepID=A0ABP8TUX6_9ACTN